MNNDQKHNNQDPDTSRIDSFSKQSSMKTPEGYFDDFPAKMGNITKNIPASSAGKTIIQQVLSHPWVAAAAAAVVGAVIVGTVLLTSQNSSNQHPKPTTTTASDSHNIEKHNKTPGKNSQSKNGQQRPNNNQQDNNPDYISSPALVNNNSDSLPGPEKTTDTSKNKSPNYPNKKAHDHESPGQYAQKENQETIHKPPEAIYDHQYTGGNNQQKTAIADDNAIVSFYPDTCLDAPAWFVLPDVPRDHSIEWANTPDQQDSLLIKESGTYSAFLFDENGNKQKTLSFNVTYLPEPSVNLHRMYSGCINKNIKLDPGFYSKAYKFVWSNGVESPVNFVSSRHADKQKYILNVRGCKTYTYQTLVVFEPCDLTIPNVITPNGDGINDSFIIQGLENYPGSKLIIMNRSGQKLFESNNYQNDFQANNLPEGSYYYILRVNDKNQTTKKGNLNIIK